MNSALAARVFLKNNTLGVFSIVRACSSSKSSTPASKSSTPASKASIPASKSSGPKITSSASPSSSKQSPKSSSPSIPPIPNYVSAATPSPLNHPVGPGALKTGDYKNVEYFCYNDQTFYDFEIEMEKDRLPQPKSGNELL